MTGIRSFPGSCEAIFAPCGFRLIAKPTARDHLRSDLMRCVGNHNARYTTTFDQRLCPAQLNSTLSYVTDVEIALLHSVAIALNFKPVPQCAPNGRTTDSLLYDASGASEPRDTSPPVRLSPARRFLAIHRVFHHQSKRRRRLSTSMIRTRPACRWAKNSISYRRDACDSACRLHIHYGF